MSEEEKKTGSDTYHIPKLTEENYRTWAQQLRWILDEKELLEVVEGKETEPAALPAQASDTLKSEYEMKLATWNKKMKKARSTIGASVTPSVMTYIDGMDDPAKMWQVLADRYNPKSQATLLQLVREFMTAKKDDSIDMEHHLQRVQRLKRQVEEQGEKISDTIYNSVLLNSVPDDYKITVSILESQEKLTPTTIINRLLEETRKIYGAGGGDTKVALMSNSSSGNPAGKTKKKDTTKINLKCTSCGKNGHVEADCWTKHPEKRPTKSGSKSEKKKEKAEAKYAMSAVLGRSERPVEPSASHWYLDSGASEHFSPHRHLFETFKELNKPCEITTAEGTTVMGTGIGSIILSAITNDGINTLHLNNVIYAPKMDVNLLSTITLYDRGYEISMNPKKGVEILKDGAIVASAVRDGKLFKLRILSGSQARAATAAESIKLWHHRLVHLGEDNVRKLEKMATGIKLDKGTSVGVCSFCLEGGQTRQPSHEPSDKINEPLDLIHSDTSGQISPTSSGGANYYATFTDDATKMSYIASMETKSAAEMLEKFKEFKAEVENQLGRKIKRLRTDGGGEYKKTFGKYLKENGIVHETTVPYSPDQNGVSERANRTIMDRARAILAQTGLPKILWMEIAATIVYLKNRSPTRSLKGKTPYEAWFGRKPDLSHLKILGTPTYIHIPEEKRVKLDSHSHVGQLVGYGGTANQYRVWDHIRKDVVVARDVVFDESLPASQLAILTSEPTILDEIRVLPVPAFSAPSPTASDDSAAVTTTTAIINDDTDEPTEEEYIPAASGADDGDIIEGPRRGKGQRAPRYDQIDWSKPATKKTARLARTVAASEPQSFTEAVNHPMHSKQWEQAILDEYNSLVKNKTWTLTTLPAGRKAISCKWVFKHKMDENGDVVRFKARLVARGFSQVYGIDYMDTFAPVAKLASLRILLALAAAEDLEIHQMDVVTAFLIPDLKEEIYMVQPEGFDSKERLVCKLQKGLYGLKQSARIWNARLHQHLKSLGFQQSSCDPCVYINSTSGIIVAVWVDDLIILGKDLNSIDKVKEGLRAEFEMKDLGELQYFLGIQVQRDRSKRRLHINQSGYISLILERFGMEDSKPAPTPIATGTTLHKATDGDALVDLKPYQSLVAVSQVSQHSSAPTPTHQSTGKRGFRYLNATSTMGITYDGSHGLELEAYCDADYAASEGRKSIMAFLFKLAGAAVSWMSKLEPTVAISSTESEYMALLQAVKESIWIQRFLKELGRYSAVKNANRIMEDNQGAIALAHNPEYHARTKHIDVQYHFVRECIEMGKVELVYCPTEEMVADALTKPLARDRHWNLLGKMGLETMEDFNNGKKD
jgi:Reverse transcriptase (RNA-dependent DNA polymerase)/gag-polypeptide of LTR copia-type/Integrase core domain